ncbi:MAG: hypothetical protein MJE68_28585 [Proteobacteria bacterium]|nr:hypothetical protein [Pseudomonadota bacterium]
MIHNVPGYAHHNPRSGQILLVDDGFPCSIAVSNFHRYGRKSTTYVQRCILVASLCGRF